jgi:hypothetical protein
MRLWLISDAERLMKYVFEKHLAIIATGFIFLFYSVALVQERTISIECRPLVGEVSANFCG